MAVTNTLYLTRKTNGTFCKYENVTAISLTGQVSSYSGVTGAAATDVITVAGSAFVNGYAVTFSSITGGVGLSANVKYYVVSASGATFKLATSQGGTAINFTTDITAGSIIVQTDELMVWSSEFRDIFTPTGTSLIDGDPVTSGSVPTMTAVIVNGTMTIAPGSAGTLGIVADPVASNSDEIGHAPLRQTFLARTHWKFTMSSGPSPLYATWADGDIISNNPPNT